MKITVVCPCGKEFSVRQKRAMDGRGKYCSQSCKYQFRTRPTGLKYNLVAENKAWFKSGFLPWNKGTKGPTPKNFKGQDVGYHALHDWVSRHRGKAKICEHCHKDHGRIEWANKSHEYKRDLDDWISLCKKCHVKYGMESKAWGVATEKFNLISSRK